MSDHWSITVDQLYFWCVCSLTPPYPHHNTRRLEIRGTVNQFIGIFAGIILGLAAPPPPHLPLFVGAQSTNTLLTFSPPLKLVFVNFYVIRPSYGLLDTTFIRCGNELGNFGANIRLCCTFCPKTRGWKWSDEMLCGAFFFFPSRLRGFREFVRPFFPCLRFLLLVLVEIISHTLIPLLRQDQSTVAQRAKTTAAECSLMSCLLARFLIGCLIMSGQRHSQTTPTSLGQGCMRV